MSDANSRQVGGNHYKTGAEEHWDLVARYGVGYLEGCATKYVSRWRKKNGVQDLEKAIHYVDKIIEMRMMGVYSRRGLTPSTKVLLWAHRVDLGSAETYVCTTLLSSWPEMDTLQLVRQTIEQLKLRAEGHGPGTPEDGGHHALQPEE